MKRHVIQSIPFALLILLSGAVTAATVVAQVGGSYDLSWWTADGGGGASSGGDYQVSGTVGQAAASDPLPAGGGRYSLSGGFWWAGPTERSIYLPMVGAGGS